ncbi:MAG: TRAP transporter substrate-binding protein [Rhodoferax sp.]|nr:TRAP transporter substrate-binding protein [Rhodoferax sp.]
MFHVIRKTVALKWLVAAFSILCVGVGPAASQSGPQKLRIVGGLAGLNQYVRHEEPFWSKELLHLSGGKFDAEIVPFDRAGVPGGDMLRLIQLGVVPFGTALVSALAQQYTEFGALDLAGLNPDMASLKRSVAAFRPYLEKTLRERHAMEPLALYVYPAQVVFCRAAMTSLSDLKGRRIRVSSATQSDFVSALGATPVVTGFAQIMANVASGNIDCAITGTMSGNTLGLHQVTSHIHALPITWGVAVFGANQSAWTALPPDLRALLSRELPKLEAAIWLESERETAEGLACNTGAAACRTGRAGQMQGVPISAQDERRRQEILASTVLPRWLQRCSQPCAGIWNQTIGPVRGMMASPDR